MSVPDISNAIRKQGSNPLGEPVGFDRFTEVPSAQGVRWLSTVPCLPPDKTELKTTSVSPFRHPDWVSFARKRVNYFEIFPFSPPIAEMRGKMCPEKCLFRSLWAVDLPQDSHPIPCRGLPKITRQKDARIRVWRAGNPMRPGQPDPAGLLPSKSVH